MRQTVTGLFETYDAAQHAQQALLQRGFPASDIELPVHEAGVLAGIERLVSSFFSTTGDVRANAGAVPEPAPHTPGAAGAPAMPEGNVLIGVRVSDEAHADLARETLRDEHALEVAIRGGSWTWASADADPVVREHSALEELGLAGIAEAMRRRSAPADVVEPQPPMAAVSPEHMAAEGRPLNEAEATVLASASAPGAGAVMGSPAAARETHVRVDIPGAPQATQATSTSAPRIPDEFIEYEEDSHDHRASDAPDRPVTGTPPTLH
jgi:hypothetical protein